MKNIEVAVSFMEEVAADNSHGYDQTHRYGPDYDCSSLVGLALKKAGYNVLSTSTTRTLFTQLKKENFEQLPITGSRRRGDIFLTPGKHVVMCCDANTIVHASINEKGKITGGAPGDQTGKEICKRTFYTPSYGWKYHLRAPGLIVQSPNVKVDAAKSFSKSMSGRYVGSVDIPMRTGAGTHKKQITLIPAGEEVMCYGYYTSYLGRKWIYAQATMFGVTYTGFISTKYLKRR